jgi:hypothetical protein
MSAFVLIGGVRLDDLVLASNGINFDDTIAFQPFTQTWRPVSYRAAYTCEPTRDLTFTACTPRRVIRPAPTSSSLTR